MTIKKKLLSALAVVALPFAGLLVRPEPAAAMIPGDAGVSGCWSWSQSGGCTMWADCYVRAGFCIVTENVYGFVYRFTVPF